MKIETKFNVDDNVWVMEDNKPKQKVITAITIISKRQNKIPQTFYELRTNIYDNQEKKYSEIKIFETKEALLDSFR